ncbi:MAG: TIGR03013 family XrtA/PEP-CTERM system glycosyltransferase, partial [Planctomycetota bacterium]
APAKAPLQLEEAIWQAWISAFMVSVLAQVAIAFNELYDFRVSSSRFDRAARFLGSAGWAILLVLASVALMEFWGVERILDFPGLPLSQTVVLLTTALIVGFTLLYFWRALFHWILRRARFNERILIVGQGRLSERIEEALEIGDQTGFEVVGVIAPGGAEHGERRRRAGEKVGSRGARGGAGGAGRAGDTADTANTGNPWFEALSAPAAEGPLALAVGAPAPARLALAPRVELAEAETLHSFAVRAEVDQIIVALSDRRGSLPTSELLSCRLEGLSVVEGEAFYERLTGKIPAEAMRPSYLIFNAGFLQHPLTETLKRSLDIIAASSGLLLVWPVMCATALAVRFDSPGPVLFRQERTGRMGRPFTLLKFRSMREDAEKLTGPVWAQENDPRVTRVGRFLRKSRLDELPQLLNVLAGSMSLVGPRPERPNFVADLAKKIPYFEQRHIVKPGVTGWAQINYPYGNTEEDALQKLQYDLFYIKYQSTLFDLSILFNTIKIVLLRKGT